MSNLVKKQQLLAEIAPLGRGARATSVQKLRVEKLCKELEKKNPNRQALKSDLINGEWELLYTTSESILGTNRLPFLRPQGPIYQTIDAPALRARNNETWPFYNQVTADLSPLSGSEVAVQFDKFKVLGLFSFQAPPSAKGSLDTTFLDDDLRISRGDKGNLFVLRMNDRSIRLGS